jgi:hypothetical protein
VGEGEERGAAVTGEGNARGHSGASGARETTGRLQWGPRAIERKGEK